MAFMTAMTFDLDWVRAQLPSHRIEWHPSIDSTMTAASSLAREGAPSGTIVGADQQTQGIGRHGHPWHSEPGTGLYVSFVLRPSVGAEALPLVMLALGLATRDAIVETASTAPDLRWPNDVLLDGKKCAGILAQKEDGAIIAGIGINIGHRAFPPEIEPLATSLLLAGATVSREAMLVALAKHVAAYCDLLSRQGAEPICMMFTQASSYASGRRVRVFQTDAQDDGIIEGVTRGLDPFGFLIVRQDNGKDATILAGGVRPA
jgi:BirA family transcriptional regulator, biotin operon repressor / biotin---[acetyl-CoA-carboxylase] ligase